MILDCQNICKAFGTDVILDNISFHLEEKEKMAIVGINGAGKTTLLKIIMGEESADSGQVIASKDRTIGYLSQYQESNYNTTVRGVMMDALKPILELQDRMRELEHTMAEQTGEELERSLELYNRYTHEFEYKNGYSCESEANGVLKGLGFSKEDYDRHTDSLSGGQRTRLALGRLLMVKPDIIILDEPTVGLDPKQIIEIRDLIKSLGKKHTVILSSHILSEVSAVCDYVMIIAKGQLVASDTPENLSKLMLGSNTVTCTVHGTRKQLVPARNALDAKEIQYENTPNEEQIKVKITTEKDKDIREELFYALAKANCPILELTSSSMSLEDVFLELTDDSGKAARKLKKAEKEQLKQKECEKECEPEADKTAVGETSEEKSTDACIAFMNAVSR